MPVITVALTTGTSVYAATSAVISASVAIQAHRNNTDAVYFDDGESPDATLKTGLEFAAPVAGQQMPVLSYGGDNNPVQLNALKFTSPSDGQKVTVFYKQT